MVQNIFQTALKSLISIIALFVLTRVMGKKQISQLTYFDYAAGISIGSIAAAFAIDPSIEYSTGLTGMLIFAILPIIFSFISLKSYRGRKLLDGVPTILIQNGEIIEENLIKAKLNVNDLLEECRQKNAFDIADIEFAILETSGRLSLLLKSQNQPITLRDLNMQAPYKGLCVNIIIDGNILEAQLSFIGKDKYWLDGELKKQGISTPLNVLLAYYDSSNNLNIHKKENSSAITPLT